LRGVQTRRRAREVQLVSHRHEVPEMPQFHLRKARRHGAESATGIGPRESYDVLSTAAQSLSLRRRFAVD
jgi:hypothetical protein